MRILNAQHSPRAALNSPFPPTSQLGNYVGAGPEHFMELWMLLLSIIVVVVVVVVAVVGFVVVVCS